MKFAPILLAILIAKFAYGQKSDFDNIKFPDVFPKDFRKFHANKGGRIIGGQIASFGQFPYQAGLRMNKGGQFYWCGGVLVSDSYVLTAGHCASDSDSIEVYLGAHKIRELEEEGRVNVVVTKGNYVVHKSYNPNLISDDIAILKLPQKIQFTDMIKPILLPTRSDAKKTFSDEEVVASGWGRPSDSVNSISEVLQFAKVFVQPENICKHFFNGYILPSNICTDTGLGKGICNGDSGGPVAIVRNDIPTLLGLSSFVSSIACVDAGFPSVFVRVSYYLDWIAANSDLKIVD